MCLDRMVSIFCAMSWLTLGPVPGRDDARNGAADPAAVYAATAAAGGVDTGVTASQGPGADDAEAVTAEDGSANPDEAITFGK